MTAEGAFGDRPLTLRLSGTEPIMQILRVSNSRPEDSLLMNGASRSRGLDTDTDPTLRS